MAMACLTMCLMSNAMAICVLVAGGRCKDIETGKEYVQSGDKLVGPETDEVYMGLPKPSGQEGPWSATKQHKFVGFSMVIPDD